MQASSLFSLFLLGLSGTGHCLGMCGPLVLAFPGKSGKFDSHLCYHAGRIITYTGIGVLMGSLGLALAKLASVTGLDYLATLARIQLVFSLLAGIFLALFGLGQLGILGQSEWLMVSNPQIIPGYRFIVRSAFQRSDRWLMVIYRNVYGLYSLRPVFCCLFKGIGCQPANGGRIVSACIWSGNTAGTAASGYGRLCHRPSLPAAPLIFFPAC